MSNLPNARREMKTADLSLGEERELSWLSYQTEAELEKRRKRIRQVSHGGMVTAGANFVQSRRAVYLKYNLWKPPPSDKQLFLTGGSKEGSGAEGQSSLPNISLQHWFGGASCPEGGVEMWGHEENGSHYIIKG